MGDPGSIPGSGRFPGEGNRNPLHILAWKIPWMEEPGGLQSIGLQPSYNNLLRGYAAAAAAAKSLQSCLTL